MRSFFQRISSRKFLTSVAVQVAAIAALFFPSHSSAISEAAVRIAALLTLLLAGLGYGKMESAIDAGQASRGPTSSEPG